MTRRDIVWYTKRMTRLLEQAIAQLREMPEPLQDLVAADFLRRVEKPTAGELAAIAEGSRAFERGEYVSLNEWIHDVGPGDR